MNSYEVVRKGIRNINGCLCYFIAVMQSVLRTEPLCHLMLRLELEDCGQEEKGFNAPQIACLTLLRYVKQYMFNDESKQKINKQSSGDVAFSNLLKRVLFLSEETRGTGYDSQQDAELLFTLIVEVLTSYPETQPDWSLWNTLINEDAFAQMMITTETKCNRCGEKVEITKPMRVLYAPLHQFKYCKKKNNPKLLAPAPNFTTLEELLNNQLDPNGEIYEGSCNGTCNQPNANSNIPHEDSGIKIESLPSVLFIRLVRSHGYLLQPCNNMINVPETMYFIVNEYCSSKVTRDLPKSKATSFEVFNLHGLLLRIPSNKRKGMDALASGHYVAYVRNDIGDYDLYDDGTATHSKAATTKTIEALLQNEFIYAAIYRKHEYHDQKRVVDLCESDDEEDSNHDFSEKSDIKYVEPPSQTTKLSQIRYITTAELPQEFRYIRTHYNNDYNIQSITTLEAIKQRNAEHINRLITPLSSAKYKEYFDAVMAIKSKKDNGSSPQPLKGHRPEGPKFHVLRGDLFCLRPGKWLTDAIINHYLER